MASADTAPAPTKPATKAAPRKATVATAKGTGVVLEAHRDGPTKNWTRWVGPAGSGLTGTLYAPLDVTEVKVLLVK